MVNKLKLTFSLALAKSLPCYLQPLLTLSPPRDLPLTSKIVWRWTGLGKYKNCFFGVTLKQTYITLLIIFILKFESPFEG